VDRRPPRLPIFRYCIDRGVGSRRGFHLEALRLANLRSLVDTGMVDVAPITLLLGTNSSGKSSFLRAFPLLKQSIETATSNPILWFGRYVDFGSIEDAINLSSSNKSLVFGFRFVLPPERTHFGPYYTPYPLPYGQQADVHLTLVPTAKHGSRVSACNLQIHGKKISLTFDDVGNVTAFRVGQYSVLPGGTLRLADTAVLIPTLTSDAIPEGERAVIYQPYSPNAFAGSTSFVRRRRGDSPLEVAVLEALRAVSRKDSSLGKLYEIMRPVRLGSDEEMAAALDEKIMHGRSLRPISMRAPERVSQLIALLWAQAVPQILAWADERISRFVANSIYLGPLRATAQRYYRAQDLSVREVDFRGENLAMFLRSLSDSEQRSLSEFTRDHFGFAVSRSGEGGHVEIRVKATDAPHEVNLADAGFGYSQMLPLIALMWSAHMRSTRSGRGVEPVLVAMEQPELHLHPAHQARLADMFAAVAGGNESRVRLMIETHSEAMVNRFGELISEGRLAAQKVRLAVFEHQEAEQVTRVRFAGYNEDGSLSAAWPFGFFSP